MQVLVKTNGATEGQMTVNKNEKGMKIKELAIIPYNSGHDAFMKCSFLLGVFWLHFQATGMFFIFLCYDDIDHVKYTWLTIIIIWCKMIANELI